MVELGVNNFKTWTVNHDKAIPDWAYPVWSYFVGVSPAVVFDGEDIVETISKFRNLDYSDVKKTLDFLVENKYIELPWNNISQYKNSATPIQQ